MRKILYITLISSLFFSCGGSKDESIAEPQNTAPTIPLLLAPSNSKLCINNSVTFEWSASTDAEKNPITYQLQISTDNVFNQIVKTIEGTAINQTADLEKGKAYYWRVKATDSKNAASKYSSTYSFYTEGVALSNHVPFSPQLVRPVLNSTITSTTATLEWTASDADATDVLSYDIYFGIDNPPTSKLGSGISTTSFNVTSLLPTKNYFWKVVVKDNKGGETSGQVWNFKTN
jgi:hypothetical protein